VHFPESSAPFFRLLGPLLANYNLEHYAELDWRMIGAVLVVAALAALGWISGRRRGEQPPQQTRRPRREDPVAAR
jgi:hypothetical protein